MSKYISPIIEIKELHSADVITLSVLFSIGQLDGVDENEESKTAIYNAQHWINP